MGDAAARGARAHQLPGRAPSASAAGSFEEARALLEAVPHESRVYAKAQYLLGVVLADPRFPGGPRRPRRWTRRLKRLPERCSTQQGEPARAARRRASWRCWASAALHYGRGRVRGGERRLRAGAALLALLGPGALRERLRPLPERGLRRRAGQPPGAARAAVRRRLPARVVDPQGDRLLLQLPLRRVAHRAGRSTSSTCRWPRS